jgi:hypothetical protein
MKNKVVKGRNKLEAEFYTKYHKSIANTFLG